MEVGLVSDEKQFWELEEAWKELQSSGAVKDITMTWEWMSTWWEVFRDGRKLATLVVRDGEKVMGIAPLISRKVTHFHLIPYMRMEFMASGEDRKDRIYSEYLDFIIRNGREKAVLEAILEFLRYSDDITWNELLLPLMQGESPVVPLLFDLAGKFSLNIEEIMRVSCYYADLPVSFEEYLSQLGKNTRYQIRRGMRKLNEAGNAVFKIAETQEEIETAKEILIRLHQSRWNQKGEPGVFSSGKFRLFHDKVIPTAHRKNWLRLGTLFLNEKPLACVYNLRSRGKIYCYQAGIEVSDRWDFSYGMLVHAYAIAHAISEGMKEYDFLGGASDYKKRLAKKQREIVTLRISKPSTKEPIYRAMCRLRESLKTLRDRLLRSKAE